ncbi:site-2 protease family protein, partial [Halobacillus sp. BBL2006]|uniref:site-2 protease family protein n=1 Tax=Halobacillus sp. BBL2006 TaxID=1543706 RepID=UPI0005424F89
IHELGHVLAALAFRTEQSTINVGSGIPLIKGKIGKVRFNIRCLVFHGAHSINERKDEFSDHQKAWICLGGPLLNAIVFFLLFLTPSFDRFSPVTLFYLFNGYLAIANLIPFRIKEKKSDGYRFIQCIKNDGTRRG